MNTNDIKIIDIWSIAKLKHDKLLDKDKDVLKYYKLCVIVNKLIDKHGQIVNRICSILLSKNKKIDKLKADLNNK